MAKYNQHYTQAEEALERARIGGDDQAATDTLYMEALIESNLAIAQILGLIYEQKMNRRF